MSYVAKFFKNPQHDYEGFFTGEVETAEAEALKRKIAKAKAELEELNRQYTNTVKPTYSCEMVPTEDELLINYSGRSGAIMYNLEGQQIDEAKEPNQIAQVSTKTGFVEFTIGYALELGSYVQACYNYKISNSGSQISLTKVYEKIVPVLEHGEEKTVFMSSVSISPKISICNSYKDGTEFTRLFYENEQFSTKIGLEHLPAFFRANKSTEVILREAPADIQDSLLRNQYAESWPMHKILQITNPEYKELKESGLISEWYRLFTNGNISQDKMFTDNKLKTVPEVIKLLQKCQEWSRNLQYFRIDRSPHQIAALLLKSFYGDKVGIRDYYSMSRFTQNFSKLYQFSKWCDYIINSVINQGYASIENYLEELKDYIDMCVGADIKPIKYTDSLKRNHDITTRNYKIYLDEHQEEIFKNRYVDIKNWVQKSKVYTVIKPECSDDVKKEGSSLGHCVASYVGKIVDGRSIIVFLRKLDTPDTSLVTVEIINEAIAQARGASNRDLTHDEYLALVEYAADNKYRMLVAERD